MHILWKSSLDNKKVKWKWNSREQGDLRSSSAILSTRVWLYCTSSENRNANALRLTCIHTTKTISTQCMMSEGISPVSSFLSLEKQQLDPYAWKGFASESITEMRHSSWAYQLLACAQSWSPSEQGVYFYDWPIGGWPQSSTLVRDMKLGY